MKKNINYMKKIIAGISAGVIVLATLFSCQDKLEDLYENPDRTDDALIEKFFTRMLDDNRVRPAYWNVRTFLMVHPAVYTQSVSYTNAPRRYQQQLSYLQNYWDDFYSPSDNGSGIIAHYREMEREYATLTEDEKKDVDVLMYAARVILYDRTSQLVDMWGDIPWSKAGSVNLTGGKISNAEFDKAEDIYAEILEGLAEAADYFRNTTLTDAGKGLFNRQDILLGGSMGKWQRYANSLRLRLLMRTSFASPVEAESAVMEMLNNPTAYPLVDAATYNVLLEPLTTNNDNMNSALTELYSHVATEFLLEDILRPANDPRIRVWFDKNRRKISDNVYEPNEDYFAMPDGISSSLQEGNIANGKYATLDSATFLYNKSFPGIVITSAEVNFLKAEAFERWGSTTDAETSYKAGVTQAVEFMFYLNQIGAKATNYAAATALDPDEITDLLATEQVEYTGTSDEKLARIWLQKWLSFGFMQSIQSWAEVRRTKYPELTFNPDGIPGAELPPTRLLYPSDEKTYNAENYAKVASKDNTTTPIFWDVL